MAPLCGGRFHSESGTNLSASNFDEERHVARAEPSAHGRQRWACRRWSRPLAGEAGRARALTGVGWSGSASPGPTVGQRQVGAAALPHCADMLSAMENSDFRKVRPCQKSCSKPLHRHTTDRGAPCALYPALKRSVVCASPVLRYPSPNRHRTKTRTSGTQLISRVFVDRRCSSCLLVDRGQNTGAAAVAPVVSNSGAGRSQAGRSQSDVIMSGIVDSGR
jgi:hypothetical protein